MGHYKAFLVAVQGFLVFLHCTYAQSVRDPRAGRSTRGGCVPAWLLCSHASTHPPAKAGGRSPASTTGETGTPKSPGRRQI